ncbi:MAG: hypothetical protein P8Z75_00805 [Gammaproteobacteria bacterium]|jgi:hypothetical protein
MSDTAAPIRPSPVLLLLLFLFAAVGLSYVSFRHRHDYVTLTINNEWRIYLMGEDRVDAVKFHIGRFRETRRDNRHLWLRGEGEIHWLKNVIRVHKAGVYFNHKMITRFYREKYVNIQFMPDGKVHKGIPRHRPD